METMTKAPTKTDLEKQVKALQRKVAKLERELATERAKTAGPLPGSPFVEQPPVRNEYGQFRTPPSQPVRREHVTPLPQNAFPWEQPK
jgi:hypothetical protein